MTGGWVPQIGERVIVTSFDGHRDVPGRVIWHGGCGCARCTDEGRVTVYLDGQDSRNPGPLFLLPSHLRPEVTS